jgi:hypothetical protein
MVHKIAIGLAALTIATACSTLNASALPGGGTLGVANSAGNGFTTVGFGRGGFGFRGGFGRGLDSSWLWLPSWIRTALWLLWLPSWVWLRSWVLWSPLLQIRVLWSPLLRIRVLWSSVLLTIEWSRPSGLNNVGEGAKSPDGRTAVGAWGRPHAVAAVARKR